jgi:hypothetical protein
VVHGIGTQVFAMHEYKLGGDETYAVSPAVAELHVGRPETEPLSIWTLYTPFTGAGAGLGADDVVVS